MLELDKDYLNILLLLLKLVGLTVIKKVFVIYDTVHRTGYNGDFLVLAI